MLVIYKEKVDQKIDREKLLQGLLMIFYGATPRGKKKDSYKKQELTIFPILGVVSQEIAFPKEERAPIYSRGSGDLIAIPANEFAY